MCGPPTCKPAHDKPLVKCMFDRDIRNPIDHYIDLHIIVLLIHDNSHIHILWINVHASMKD